MILCILTEDRGSLKTPNIPEVRQCPKPNMSPGQVLFIFKLLITVALDIDIGMLPENRIRL